MISWTFVRAVVFRTFGPGSSTAASGPAVVDILNGPWPCDGVVLAFPPAASCSQFAANDPADVDQMSTKGMTSRNLQPDLRHCLSPFLRQPALLRGSASIESFLFFGAVNASKQPHIPAGPEARPGLPIHTTIHRAGRSSSIQPSTRADPRIPSGRP